MLFRSLALHLVTRHGRATPLLWLTVDKDELKDQRNDFEDLCLSRLKALLPEGVTATILADRGFGDVKLFKFLDSLGFHYVIRFRGNIHVSAADGETRLAADWVGKGGRARKLRDAEVSAKAVILSDTIKLFTFLFGANEKKIDWRPLRSTSNELCA